MARTKKTQAIDFSSAVHSIPSAAIGQRKTCLYVLREGLGRKLQSQPGFTWDKFKTWFDAEYGSASLDDLKLALDVKLGLSTMDEVYARAKVYSRNYEERKARFA